MASPCSGLGGTGTQYNYSELEGLWLNAGGSKATAPIAAAIALAESKGCSTAQNPADNNGTQTSWGIWQISDGTHNMPAADIYNPAINAQQAVEKYKTAGNAFTDWGTFNSGAYKAFVSGRTTPDTNVPGAQGTATAQGASGCAVPDCAWGCIPNVTILGATVWQGQCLVTYKQARRVLGAGIFVGGVLVMGWGVQLLVGLAALGVATKVVGPVASEVGGAKTAVGKAQALFKSKPAPAPKQAQQEPARGAHARSRATPEAAQRNRYARTGRQPTYQGRRRRTEQTA